MFSVNGVQSKRTCSLQFITILNLKTTLSFRLQLYCVRFEVNGIFLVFTRNFTAPRKWSSLAYVQWHTNETYRIHFVLNTSHTVKACLIINKTDRRKQLHNFVSRNTNASMTIHGSFSFHVEQLVNRRKAIGGMDFGCSSCHTITQVGVMTFRKEYSVIHCNFYGWFQLIRISQ